MLNVEGKAEMKNEKLGMKNEKIPIQNLEP